MEADKETTEKIGRLQMMEQNLQAMMMQKQQFQSQLFELESALKEIEKTDKAYKIVGNIMVSAAKEDLKKDLGQKKEIVELRLATIEKQEKQFKDKAKKLQEDIMGSLATNEASGQTRQRTA